MDPTTEAQLLAAIYAEPEDDELRHVYMDWLIERGDPRGEFISLQMARHRSASNELRKADARRERELLEAHVDDWLGEVAPIVGIARPPAGDELARGFLARAVIDLGDRDDVERARLVRLPILHTVTSVAGDVEALIAVSMAAAAAGRPTLQSLRAITPRSGSPRKLATWTAALSAHPRLERIGFKHSSILRRDGQRVLRINAQSIHPKNRDWLDGLAAIDGRGWRLELVSGPEHLYERAQHRAVARDLAAQFPAFEHAFIVDERLDATDR